MALLRERLGEVTVFSPFHLTGSHRCATEKKCWNLRGCWCCCGRQKRFKKFQYVHFSRRLRFCISRQLVVQLFSTSTTPQSFLFPKVVIDETKFGPVEEESHHQVACAVETLMRSPLLRHL
ncbi:unnamed protein product [Amoebophrya sp. A120]|nr:unnamed protein product [Amoebophrya sp. A120]|eukprot:GSA120T00024697001.1